MAKQGGKRGRKSSRSRSNPRKAKVAKQKNQTVGIAPSVASTTLQPICGAESSQETLHAILAYTTDRAASRNVDGLG
eukprot:1517983-Amphidinium_carterae.1